MRFYIDTCIWIDFFEDRNGKNKRGLNAREFLVNILFSKCVIVSSSAVFDELLKRYTKKELQEKMKKIEHRIKLIKTNQKQENEAKMISRIRKLSFQDTFHAIIARDNNCVLITRDKDFSHLADFIEYYKPEEIIENNLFF